MCVNVVEDEWSQDEGWRVLMVDGELRSVIRSKGTSIRRDKLMALTHSASVCTVEAN